MLTKTLRCRSHCFLPSPDALSPLQPFMTAESRRLGSDISDLVAQQFITAAPEALGLPEAPCTALPCQVMRNLARHSCVMFTEGEGLIELQGRDGFGKPVRSQSHAISYLQTIPSVQKNEIFICCCGLQGFLTSPARSSSQQLWNLPRLLLFICNKLFSTCCGAPAVYPQRDHIRLLWSLPRLFLLIRNELSSSSCCPFQGVFLSPATSS